MITCGTPTGWLSADTVPLHCSAWTIPDVLDLWMGGDVRGQDRLIPGLPGMLAYKRRRTLTEHSLPMLICGDVDLAGAPYSDPWVGLETNINYLRTNVVDPTNVDDGTRAFVLHMPSGATRAADCHVLRLVRGEIGQGTMQDGATGVLMRATLEISIPKPGVFI